jgi:basic amino acid/polyamine antiporter, APA family
MPDSKAASSEVTAPPGATLARTMGLWALVVYGVGDMLGSGVYALIGKVAGTMGNAVWVAFMASMVAALLTGLSYASLGSRYPRAAGVAYITHRAFHLPFLSFLLGLGVVASGLTSFATQSRTFTGYFLGMMGQPEADPGKGIGVVIILAFILVLSFINFWGMREATWLNMLCTAVEVSGLFIVIAVGIRYWGGVNYLEVPPAAGQPGAAGALTAGLVLQGAVLTFYSFIGFEDMINVTEEVKDPRRNFPRAVMLALAITTVIYIAIAVSAISVVPYRELAASGQPLVEVVKRAAPAFPSVLFSFIALFAITNTGLLNYIMGSRLVYGMAQQGFVPRVLGAVHPVRRTPYVSILLLMVVVTLLAFSGNIKQLASATSVLLLTVFIVVNASLIVLQRRPDEPKGAFEIPSFVPAGGILVCATMLYFADPVAMGIALALLAGITVLYLIARPKNITEETLAEAAEEA